MKSIRFPAVLLAMTLSVIGVGCSSSTMMVDAPIRRMTMREAQVAFVESLNHLWFFMPPIDVKFTRQMVRFKLTITSRWAQKGTFDFIVKFADLGKLSIRTKHGFMGGGEQGKFIVESDATPAVQDETQRVHVSFENELHAKMLANALFILKESATAPDTEEADFAAFSEAAKVWLAADPKPTMSDEARTSKALAEDAFKRKDFGAAFDAYVDALRMHPMWPDGHFNAALLAAEVEDYRAAAAHMRRYLFLAPDAKDASAAKDKYLLWKAKSKS